MEALRAELESLEWRADLLPPSMLRHDVHMLYDRTIEPTLRPLVPLLDSLFKQGLMYTINKNSHEFKHRTLDEAPKWCEPTFYCEEVKRPALTSVTEAATHLGRRMEADALGLQVGRWKPTAPGLFGRDAWPIPRAPGLMYPHAFSEFVAKSRAVLEPPLVGCLPYSWKHRQSWSNRDDAWFKGRFPGVERMVFFKSKPGDGVALFRADYSECGILHRLSPTIVQFEGRLYLVASLSARFRSAAVGVYK